MDVPRYRPLVRARPSKKAAAQAGWDALPAEMVWLIGQYIPRMRCVCRRFRDILRRWTPDDAEAYLHVRALLLSGRIELRGKPLNLPVSFLDLAWEKEYPWEARHVLDEARRALGCAPTSRCAYAHGNGGGWTLIAYALPHQACHRNDTLRLIFPDSSVPAAALRTALRVLRAQNSEYAASALLQ